MKDFNNLLNPIKILILICLKKNRLVDAECSRRIFYFSKVIHFSTKKNSFKLVKKSKHINITDFWSLTFAASVDVDKILYLIRESFYQYNK